MRTHATIACTALLLPTLTNAAQCIAEPLEISVGGDSDLVICGAPGAGEFSPDALHDAGLQLVYEQTLERCQPDDKRPGRYWVIAAAADATDTTLEIYDTASGAALCELAIAVRPALAATPQPWLNAMPLQNARYIDADGIRTRYFESGDGPALILVHGGQAGGANNSAQKWEQNFTALSEHFRVIALDRLGQAGTDNPDSYDNYFADDATHLESFIDALGLKQVALAGHSQGGWPVTRVALNRPELVSCVVNIDTVMVPDDAELMRAALAFLIYTARFTDPPTGPTFYSSRRGMRMRYPTGANITAAKAQRVVDQYQAPKTQTAAAAMSAAGMTPLHPSFVELKQQAFADIAAGQLKAKSLVIWGELDPQVPLGLGEQFQAMLLAANADSSFHIIEGTGHAPFIEQPDEFNQLVIDYCGE